MVASHCTRSTLGASPYCVVELGKGRVVRQVLARARSQQEGARRMLGLCKGRPALRLAVIDQLGHIILSTDGELLREARFGPAR